MNLTTGQGKRSWECASITSTNNRNSKDLIAKSQPNHSVKYNSNGMLSAGTNYFITGETDAACCKSGPMFCPISE